MTREEAIQKLLKSYQAYYNINENDNGDDAFVARCDFFEHAQKYVLSKKAELWSTKCEEFIYLFSVPNLTESLYEKYTQFAIEDGNKRMNIGPGHMYTYITPIFICDTCDGEAVKKLKKHRLYKSFHFSLHGWLDFHVSAVALSDKRIYRNSAGRYTAKILKKVLFHKK